LPLLSIPPTTTRFETFSDTLTPDEARRNYIAALKQQGLSVVGNVLVEIQPSLFDKVCSIVTIRARIVPKKESHV
jgi:hypothetical protein